MTAVQRPPSTRTDYRAFPAKRIPAGAALYRAHRVTRSAWWFDAGADGRFTLADPRGTCYAATEVETAVRERVRDELGSANVVSRVFAESFTVSRLIAPADRECAAVSSSGAARFGVVRALVTMGDYSIPQAWARTFDAHGFDGVFYGSAYTTGKPSALALFGEAGSPGVGHESTAHLGGPEACATAGMTVLGPPRLGMLRVL